MLKLVLIVIVVVVLAAVLIVLLRAAMRPGSFRVSRSVTIKAKPEKVFALLDDFKAWTQWSPFENRDPNMTRTYGPTTKGKGATYSWAGDNKTVGAGRMEIIDCAAPYKLLVKLDFARPMEGHNTAEFTVEPESGEVKTTWAMFGPSPLMHRVMGQVFNFDRMIGKDFEQGLANLKAAAEK